MSIYCCFFSLSLPPPSLSLSLSLTHTHTHTGTYTNTNVHTRTYVWTHALYRQTHTDSHMDIRIYPRMPSTLTNTTRTPAQMHSGIHQAYKNACIRAPTRINPCTHKHTHTHTHTYIYIYIYISALSFNFIFWLKTFYCEDSVFRN